jgi:hypothetical protein
LCKLKVNSKGIPRHYGGNQRHHGEIVRETMDWNRQAGKSLGLAMGTDDEARLSGKSKAPPCGGAMGECFERTQSAKA